MEIDLNTVREIKAHCAGMARHYGESELKQRQNEALVAAGLPPMHTLSSLQWDTDQRQRYQQFADTCDAILAHFGEMVEAEAA